MVKKPDRVQVRVYLREDTIQQVKLMSLLLGRDGSWNEVLDDMIRMGVAYANRACKLELVSWDDSLKLFDLDQELGLTAIRGRLPMPEGR